MASLVAELRSLTPHRPLSVPESLRVAELQANRLLRSSDVHEPAVPEGVITELPRIAVERVSRAPVSGAVRWSRGFWLVAINRGEPLVRQRYTLAHELKHVLDAPFGELLYPEWRGMSEHDRAEHVANHFAACLLMPKAWVTRHYFDKGVTDLRRLAYRFEVSQTAMRIRLESLGVLAPAPRCGYRVAA